MDFTPATKDCPAILGLKAALAAASPFLAGKYIEKTPKGPVPLSRLQGLTQGKKELLKIEDPHVHGLALDIICFAKSTGKLMSMQEEYLGDSLFMLFFDFREALGWSNCIWKTKIMNERHLPAVYNGGKDIRHTTHVHIDWASMKPIPGENGKYQATPNGRHEKDSSGKIRAPLKNLFEKFNNGLLKAQDPGDFFIRIGIPWDDSWPDSVVTPLQSEAA
jgi:hypothetical protein